MTAPAELIEDGGAAAADGDNFFRSPSFLEAEGVSHTLRLAAGSGELHVPLVVRRIPGSDRLDAVSPYGYPGASTTPPRPLDPDQIDWTETGLVSLFLRDRVGDAPYLASDPRSQVLIVDPSAPPRMRASDRNQVNRNARLGYVTERIVGSASSDEQRTAFHRLYTETMRRVGADERYLFSGSYFDTVLDSDRAWLVLTSDSGGSAAAGAMVAQSDGYLHYFLSGTADEFRHHAPAKSVMVEMISMSGEQGLPLNLGGGATPGDSLEEFKRGFANAEAPWHAHAVVCDSGAYARLSEDSPPSGFFPAYRG